MISLQTEIFDFKNVQVSVGNGTDVKTECEYKHQSPTGFEFEVFECPSPGIVGNLITIKKIGYSPLLSSEVQVYGMVSV